jgi:hypothetical protein
MLDSHTRHSSFRGPWHNWWYWRPSGPVATRRLGSRYTHIILVCGLCVLGVMRVDTLFQMQLPMQAQSEGGKNPLATTHTANSVGNASVKRRGLVHGLTTVRAAYLLSTKWQVAPCARDTHGGADKQGRARYQSSHQTPLGVPKDSGQRQQPEPTGHPQGTNLGDGCCQQRQQQAQSAAAAGTRWTPSGHQFGGWLWSAAAAAGEQWRRFRTPPGH